uniref:Biogenesis of lysosome-related organelles complex 1 subunit 6-like n=1 Tax=Crassostrea virginica TaxID=6565 RepID=A0A8B8BJP6_CRAVI|nr:biogenesis of lysosome-related organelles complex 1 subunit 6-like [Crassostrea virginica]
MSSETTTEGDRAEEGSKEKTGADHERTLQDLSPLQDDNSGPVRLEENTSTTSSALEVDPGVVVYSGVDQDVKHYTDTDPEESCVDPSVAEKLSEGLLEICLPSLQKSKVSLDDLLQNQQVLIESVQQENGKFADCKEMEELNRNMNQAKKYHMKLINLKKEMNSLSDKAVRLKRRALKISQQKQKEDLQRVQQREREQERERMLEAKVVKRSQSAT